MRDRYPLEAWEDISFRKIYPTPFHCVIPDTTLDTNHDHIDRTIFGANTLRIAPDRCCVGIGQLLNGADTDLRLTRSVGSVKSVQVRVLQSGQLRTP